MSGAENVIPLPIDEGGIGPAPSRLATDAQRAWDDLVAATPPGILVPLHRVFLELTAMTLARWRKMQRVNLPDTDRQATKRLLRSMLAECLIPRRTAEKLMEQI